jgi:hypothetical protein
MARLSKFEKERQKFLTLADPLFNKKHWKLPTLRKVFKTEGEAHAVADALIYFLGGAEVQTVRSPSGRRVIGYRVGSLGYYHYIGA